MDAETRGHVIDIRETITRRFPNLQGAFRVTANPRGVIILDINLYGKFGFDSSALEKVLEAKHYYFGSKKTEIRGSHEHLIIEII